MMALDNVFHFLHQPLLDWDEQTFENWNSNDQLNDKPPEMEHPVSDYIEIEDEIVSWKRRIVTPTSYFPTCEDLQDVFQNFWDSSSGFGEVSNDVNGVIQERNKLLIETPNIEPTHELHELDSLCSDSSQSVSLPLGPTKQDDNLSKPPLSPIKTSTLQDNENARGKKRPRNSSMAILSPFVVVKPCRTGTDKDGCVTLDEINKKLLMRPAKPVRHPVGEFACVPRVSPGGPGLSGKEVVSLTRIYTRGSGTITIIRTRG
ncbi:hypothetical protein LUZ60_002791 [Juncus effusus]|nr:hypothetical protein LUZ60_002791 [Juncus effusus]